MAATNALLTVEDNNLDTENSVYGEKAEGNPEETNAPSGDEPSTKKRTSIAVQANDYEIERRSGVVPARRRIIPFKFRDFCGPDNEDEDSEDEYLPTDGSGDFTPKPAKTGSRKVGRPRKYPKDHSYETAEEDGDKATTCTEASDSNAEQATSLVPKRGRPAKNEFRSNSGKPYRCPTCKKGFTQKGNLKVHQVIHTGARPFACDHDNCFKAFRSNESLRRHKLAHMGIKLFKCELCDKMFSSNVAMKEHMSRHTNEKPHPCPYCDRKFRQVSCLRRHMLTHSGDKPHECPVCHARFSQMVYIRSHMRKHTGEKPYKCDLCQKQFAYQSDLNRHKNIHTGEKKYECEVCHAKFSDPSSKRRHVKEHNGYKPYVCSMCGDSFKRAGQLKAHLNKKHNYKLEGEGNVLPNLQEVEVHKDSDGLKFIPLFNKSINIQAVPSGVQISQQDGGEVSAHIVTDSEGNVYEVVQNNGMMQLQGFESEGQISLQDAAQLVQDPHIQVAQVLNTEVQVMQVGDGTTDPTLNEGGQQIILDQGGRQIIVTPAPGQEDMQLLQEQTEQIVAQIQSQLQEQVIPGDASMPLQVSYQIIHDDENQQIVEIQYLNPADVGEDTTAEVPPDDASQDNTDNASPEMMEVQEVEREEQEEEQQEDLNTQDVPDVDNDAASPCAVHGVQDASVDTVHQDAQEVLENVDANIQETQPGMDNSGQDTTVTKVHYEQDMALQTEDNTVTEAFGYEEDTSQTDQEVPQEKPESETDFTNVITSHYVAQPDFNSQEYYNWLSNFTEICKLVAMPLDVDLFQRISLVHKTLSDVLANPKGILTNRENFRTLMSISSELNTVINEHLAFVLEKLDDSEAPGDSC